MIYALILTIKVVLAITLIVQYLVLLVEFFSDGYTSKKEVLLSLIPFFPVVVNIYSIFKKLK
jgi:hypothetical protein